jgi:hypothetical protein
MADIIAWEGVPVRAAAFRALPASEQAKLASPEPLKEVYRKGIENRATRLQREYAKNRHALERLARIRKARMLRRHRKTHGVGAGVFGKTTSPMASNLETIGRPRRIKRYLKPATSLSWTAQDVETWKSADTGLRCGTNDWSSKTHVRLQTRRAITSASRRPP